jgi:alpha-tubulin suppressor-like RCC1 family protein
VYAWGNNDTGQLGNNNGAIFMRSSPVAIVGGLKFMDLAVGHNYAVGLTTSGDAYSWGDNSTGGQLGDNSATTARSSPVAVVGGLKYAKVGCGFFMTSAMTQAGGLYSWGFNSFGQLGDGTTVSRSSPVVQVGSKTYNPIRTLFKNAINIPVTPGVTYSMATVAPTLQAAGVPVAALVGVGGSLLIQYFE